MKEVVDVRTVGWNDPNCVDIYWKDKEVFNDWTGEYSTESERVKELRCDTTTINAKTDYCKTCQKTLIYP